MVSYVNTARHAITLPSGRPVGAGEQFDSDEALGDFALAGWLLNVDEQNAPPPSPPAPTPQRVASVQSDEAFGEHSVTQSAPAEDSDSNSKPAQRRRQTRKRGDT